MGVFERKTVVDATFDEVWDFHSRVEGLENLTPGWMALEVESVKGPDGEPDPEILEVGSTIEMSVKPIGVGPRASWMSKIVERENTGNEAYFRDEMVRGPFKKWNHTHSFTEVDEGVEIHDRVEYKLPLWMLGRAGSPFFGLQLRALFRTRHKKTKEVLEN